ncbi:uncharacterized protein LOC111991432 isoform X2 [Quercus suber]|uniref:uncharacterized protein LOC111991432 isoform X2 n=1 Tax=Quercus suber TaxID=58331 RepID=UPI0032DF38DF
MKGVDYFGVQRSAVIFEVQRSARSKARKEEVRKQELEVLHTRMGRKRRLEFVEPGESSSHVGSNEVPSRQQAPPTDDDKRHSQGSDDETQPPDTHDVLTAGVIVVPNKHGPNRFDDIWNMPPGKKLFLEINKVGQPVGKNAGSFSRWLGTVARTPDMCPINYCSWQKMPLQYKNRCWEAIQARWVIPTNCIPLAKQRKWALSQIKKLWRGHKSELKEQLQPGHN